MTSKKVRMPKDLQIEISSKKQKLWETVLKEAKVLIEGSENNLIIQHEIKKLAEKKLAEEKEKFK